MIIIITVYLAASFPLSVFGSTITAYESFIFQKLINIIRVITLPAIMIPLLLNGYKSVAMAAVQIGVGMFALLINAYFCLYKLKIKIEFKNFEHKLLKEIGEFSLFVFFKIIFIRICWSTGQFVIGSFLGAAAVAIFAIGIQIRGYFHAFAEAINSLFLPRLTILSATKSSIKIISDLFIKTGRIQMHIMGYLLSVYLLFGLDFVTLWAGADYHDSYLISLIIIIPTLVPLIQAIAGILLQANNRLKFQVGVYFIMAIITIILSVWLTKRMGAIGSAISLAIAIIIGEVFLMNWYYWKKIKLDIPKFWVEIIKIIIPIVFFVILFSLLLPITSSQNLFELIKNILIYSVLYFPVITYFCFNKYEKNLIKSVLLKITTLLNFKKQ
jgi:O-antigen/teichoic acid export membrane protein